MPLEGSALGAIIKSKLAASAPPTNEGELTDFANALGDAIVTYIKASAIVVLDPTTSVTTGAGAGGTVVGTGKVT